MSLKKEIKRNRKIYFSKNKEVGINDMRHPLQIMADRIVEEVIEIHCGDILSEQGKIRVKEDIVALLSNL